MTTWVLVITLTALEPGWIDQTQEIAQPSEATCLAAKAKLERTWPYIRNPHYQLSVDCVEEEA